MSPNAMLEKTVGRAWNPRVVCGITLTLVFLCGALTGALAHKSLHKAPFWTDSGKTAYLERLKKDLDLTPAQAEQMESILDDFSTYYRNVMSDGKARIMQILNDDQRHRFERILQERQRQ